MVDEDKRRKRYPKFVKPAGRRLLCKRMPEVESSILHLPSRCTQNSLMFEVLETGPLCIWEHIVQKGDFVFTGAHGYVMLPLYKNPDIYIINEEDVLAVVSRFEEDESDGE